MTFFVYSAQRGTAAAPIFNMDHLLSCSPNIQLNSEMITFKTDKQGSAEKMIKETGCWFRLTDVNEQAMQPLIQSVASPKTEFDAPGLHFVPGAEFDFEAFPPGDDPTTFCDEGRCPEAQFTGRMCLGPSVFADYAMLNADGGAESKGMAKEALVGSSADTSGLVAEYPNPLSSVELRNR